MRPPFETKGYWLEAHGIALHLFVTKTPHQRQQLWHHRLEHFGDFLPNVDHIAFLCYDFDGMEAALTARGVKYRRVDVPLTGATQLFVFDPDNNLIELSNCAPPPTGARCESVDAPGGE